MQPPSLLVVGHTVYPYPYKAPLLARGKEHGAEKQKAKKCAHVSPIRARADGLRLTPVEILLSSGQGLKASC